MGEDKIAIDGLVQGEGVKVEGGKEGLVKAIEEIYKKDVTDEFLKPIIVETREGLKTKIPYSALIIGLIGCEKLYPSLVFY